MTELEPWVGIQTVADHLDVSTRSVRRYREAGTIPGVKVGGKWKFQLSEVNKAIQPPPPSDPFAQSSRARTRNRAT